MPKVQSSFVQTSGQRWSPIPSIEGDRETPPLHASSASSDPSKISTTQTEQGSSQAHLTTSDEVPTTSLETTDAFSPELGNPASPPSTTDTTAALTDLRAMLESPSGNSKGEQLFYKRIGAMIQLLEANSTGEDWIAAAKRISPVLGRGNAWPLKLRRWTKDFVRDRSELPYPQSAFQGRPPYIDDEGLRDEVTWLLRRNAPNISHKTVIDFLKDPSVQARYHIRTHDVLTPAQARHWMADLGFTSSTGGSRRQWVRNLED
ncbi:hypothetical protein BJ322DRAFT_1060913 [Thelephora terrestris]|uniref:Uncharacterized protein n=1 Tax=Thelephora terrestris TaxID=56493 RepID=A0A9P6L6N4_9AGAM|nr:hypothetical protein BJ322DRAFT_1060913 [Thelephora terrestris]